MKLNRKQRKLNRQKYINNIINEHYKIKKGLHIFIEYIINNYGYNKNDYKTIIYFNKQVGSIYIEIKFKYNICSEITRNIAFVYYHKHYINLINWGVNLYNWDLADKDWDLVDKKLYSFNQLKKQIKHMVLSKTILNKDEAIIRDIIL